MCVLCIVKYHPVCLPYILQLCTPHTSKFKTENSNDTQEKQHKIVSCKQKKEKIESECKQNNMIMKICYVV